jgi:CheY-like chemotaxis protein
MRSLCPNRRNKEASLKILHLEDSLVHQESVRELLAQARPDWNLTQASRMSQAMDAYERDKFDAVICDPRLEHDDDGLDFAVDLHRAGQAVIITSAYLDNQRPGIAFVAKQNLRTELIPTLEQLVTAPVAAGK